MSQLISLVGQHVTISLDGGSGAAVGVLKELTEAGATVLLDSTSKLYFYPMVRVFVIGAT